MADELTGRVALAVAQQSQEKPGPPPFEAWAAKTLAELAELRAAKDADYGAAWLDMGYLGLMVRMWDKAKRLRQLTWLAKQAQVKDESAKDTARDLLNYCLMFLYCLEFGNVKGER